VAGAFLAGWSFAKNFTDDDAYIFSFIYVLGIFYTVQSIWGAGKTHPTGIGILVLYCFLGSFYDGVYFGRSHVTES
jgi:hypothetical protein